MSIRPVLRLPENKLGRDFIVGDLHGGFRILKQALINHCFDPFADRLFIAGDTIDRGPDSEHVDSLLERPWVYCVRGNHEDMLMELGHAAARVDKSLLEPNGMEWFKAINQEKRDKLLNIFASLPLAIEIETPRGTVGVVHADVPKGMDWSTFTAKLEQGCERTIHTALWSRLRLESKDASGVKGIGRLFVGHTIQSDGPKRLGNVYYIDTGSFLTEFSHTKGSLTFASLACETQVLCSNKEKQEIDRIWSKTTNPTVKSKPFGNYSF